MSCMDLRRVLEELRPHFGIGNSSAASKTGSSCSVEWRKKLHTLYISGSSAQRDDLIFIVKWLHSEKKEELEVFRKHSSSLPGQDDADVLWDQSFYLNLLMHEFEYHVTCSAVTLVEGTARIDKTLMAVSQRVYPSTSKQRMDKRKGRCEMAYPNIIFSLDNFQEVFSELHVSAPGEKISFLLEATNTDCNIKQTIFIGAIDYQILVEVYRERAKEEQSLMSKMKRFSQRFKSSSHANYSLPMRYYTKMAGPNSKGRAEVAIYRKDIFPQDDAPVASSKDFCSDEKASSLSAERDWFNMHDYQGSGAKERNTHSPCAGERKTLIGGNGTGKDVNGTGKDVNGTGEDVNGTGKDVNGTGKDVNGTGKDVNGTGKDVNGTGEDVNGTVKDVNSECRDNVNIDRTNLTQSSQDFTAQTNGSGNNSGDERSLGTKYSGESNEVDQEKSKVLASSDKHLLSSSAENDSVLPLIYANLTYIELSWHFILQDILNLE